VATHSGSSEQRRRSWLVETFLEVSLTITSALDLSTILQRVVQLSMNFISADAGSLTLLASEGQPRAQSYVVNLPAAALDDARARPALFQQVIETSEPVVINDYPAHPAAQEEWLACGVRAVLIAPIIMEDTVLGLLALYRLRPGPRFTPRMLTLLQTIGQQAGAAIVNTRRYETERKRARELEALQASMAEIASWLEMEPLLQAVVHHSAELLQASRADVWLYEPAFQRVQWQLSHPPHQGPRPPPERLGEGAYGRAADSGRPLIINDYRAWPERAASPAAEQIPNAVLAMPLLAGAELVGVLGVNLVDGGRQFGDHDVQLLSLFAQPVAVAIQNTRLYQSALKDADRRSLLYQASQQIGAVLDLEQLYAVLHQAVAQLMPAEVFIVSLLDEAKQTIDDVYLFDQGQRWPARCHAVGTGLSGHVIAPGLPLRVGEMDEAKRAELGDLGFGEATLHVRSVLAVPLNLRGHIVGMISAQSYAADAYTLTDQETLQQLATNAAIAIQNARLYEAAVTDSGRRALLYRASQEISGTLDLDVLCTAIHQAAARLMPCEAFLVTLYDSPRRELDDVYRVDTGGRRPRERRPLDDGSLTGYAVAHNESLHLDDVDEGRPERVTADLPESTRSVLVAVMRKGGQVIGALSAQAYTRAAYRSGDLDALELLAANAAVAIDISRLFSEVRSLATRDELTGVFNRRHFMELAKREFERVTRYPHPLSVILLDVDHFKRVNDTYGHSTGDQVLRLLATRCLHSLRDQDVLGRYGGEEFVILLPETDIAGAHLVAERLRLRVANAPLATQHGELMITISLGVAGRVPVEAMTLPIVLERADAALYQAKRAGRNQVVVWSPSP
jgi:diguanylate cyclase (GGDEF)-like protein